MSIRSFVYRSAESTFLRRTVRTVTIGGRTYRANRFFGMPFNMGAEHEPWSDKAYRTALFLKEGLFVDVGANTGQTLRRILALDAKRHYLGFEPQSECVFYLKKFIEQNNLVNHQVLPIGLSNAEGPLKLFLRENDTDSAASTVSGFRPEDFYARTNFIYVSQGDRVLEKMNLPPCAVLKVDVEGGEPEVFEGFSNTLKRQRPFVFFEVLNYFLFVTGKELSKDMIAFREERNARLMRIFRECGYTIFNMRPGDKLIETQEFRPLRISDLSICDYVGVPTEGTEAFLNRFG